MWNFAASLNSGYLICLADRARCLDAVNFLRPRSVVSKQRSHAKLDVELNHQEDEGDAEEMRDVDG